ncbi:MAG: fused MFS/spermidine synthase [Burkholderiales bacterium]|nr:fused MFS/spermidine synthase [Burkholderiales bacterium]
MKGLKRWIAGRRSSVEVSEKRGVRALHLGGDAIQSAIRLSQPDALELHYTRAMMSFMLFEPAPREILMIGLGGGSIARFAHARLPMTRMTVVEINARVLAAARSHFGLPEEDARLRIEIADGATYVPAHPGSADVLLLDAFEDGVSVKSLATQAFYDACRKALRSGGILVVNFIASERKFGACLGRIEQAFDDQVLLLPAGDRVNNIILAFNGGPARVPIAGLNATAEALKREFDLPFDRFVADLLRFNARTAGHLRLERA